ncbi:MAG: amino acid ABC transporter permease, partial [Candidatus Berkiella sp.]
MMKSQLDYYRTHPINFILNLLLSIGIITLCLYSLVHFIEWAVVKATWHGTSTDDCNPQGACWAMVSSRWDQFIYGFYPQSQRWRVDLSFLILILMLIQSTVSRFKLTYRIVSLSLAGILILYLLKGGFFLQSVPTNLWGGLFLTIFLTVGSILCAFPLAILLALGRSSHFVVIKSFCILFIEIIRGVPLISILFMASVMLPLLIPQDVVIDKLLRAFVGIMCFQAAYMAEVIRGGFNSIPKGQYEAAKSLGLSYWQSVGLILLPQTFRAIIPGLVNNLIALFKDTTLVLIIGIYDFLGIVQLATTSPAWLGTALEAYLFCGIVYWIFCFSM